MTNSNELEIDLKPEDTHAFCRHVHRRSPQMRVAYFRSLRRSLIIWIAYAAFALQISWSDPQNLRATLVFFGVAPAISFAFKIARRHELYAKTMSQLLANDSRTSDTKRVSLDAAGITVRSSLRSDAIQWPLIAGVDVTPAHAFIFIGPLEAIIVPRRCFQEPGDFFRLVHAVEKHIADCDEGIT